MVQEASGYLTVKEAAERLRAAPQTVYRWCRTGKLKALRVGKEWRIPVDQVGRRTELAGLMPLNVLLNRLTGQSEHLLGIASDRLTLGRMEAVFFDVVAATGGRMVHARWGEAAADVRKRLRPVLSGMPNRQSALHLLEFRKAYEQQEVEGPVRLLQRELKQAATDGTPCYGYGSPYAYFGYHSGRLTAYESGMDKRLRGCAALALCGYALSDLLSLYQGQVLSLIAELASCHSGVIWFDGQQALLQRPAGGLG